MDDDRKYTAPPPGLSVKDDLHEWAIYRQNLTSTIAQNLLADGKAKSNKTLPFGDFQMHDQTVESVLNRGKRTDSVGILNEIGGGEAYLKYGLPRVGFSNTPRDRKSRSELDLRPGLEDAVSVRTDNESLFLPRRGPYAVDSATTDRGYLKNKPPSGGHRRFQSMEQGLHALDGMRGTDYAMSEAGGHELVDRSSLHDYNLLRTAGQPTLSRPGVSNSSGIYWQTKSRHHHGHYFSNLDLFAQSNAYNYLRYAKADDLGGVTSKIPHLVLRNVGYVKHRASGQGQKRRILDNISFDLYGGDTLAVMYTSDEEMSLLLDVLANSHGTLAKGKPDGDIYVNGLPMRPGRQLGDRLAYVCGHELPGELTVSQTLKWVKMTLKPATSASRSSSMINQLIHTLALAPFHDRQVNELSLTERQRVKVACQILLDTDILLLDDVLQETNLYDAAFLIDYLRDWAMKLNRIVIIATNPPTLELLAMFSKSAILASGKLVYFGKASRMVEYFESIGYPCPLFKNPCDYYVDLVTHDTLNFDASQESTERIKSLANHWLAKGPGAPEPGAPGLPPPRTHAANALAMLWAFYCRFWWHLLTTYGGSYLGEVLLSALMSIALGTTFYSLVDGRSGSLGDGRGGAGRVDGQSGVDDRLGLFHILTTGYLLPNAVWLVGRVSHELKSLRYDMLHRRYSKVATALFFFVAKVFFDLPLALLSYLAYVTPVFFMARLKADPLPEQFGIYLGVSLLYCLALRSLATFLTIALGGRKWTALGIWGFFIAYFALFTGVTTHPGDVWYPLRPLRFGSPAFWTVQTLTALEFANPVVYGPDDPELFRARFKCKNKPYQPTVGLIGSRPCPISTNEQAVNYLTLFKTWTTPSPGSLTPYDAWVNIGLPVIAGWTLVTGMLGACVLMAGCCVVGSKGERGRGGRG